MAESKGALIAKSVQKHAGRAKEKVFIVLLTYLKVSQFVLKFYASAVKVDVRAGQAPQLNVGLKYGRRIFQFSPVDFNL